MICGPTGSKSNLAKATGAEPAGQMRDEKVHTVVARSTFPSQKCQKPAVSDHFWKVRCRKSARRCGGKHVRISKSKCTKHTTQTTFGSWDVEKVHAVVARSTFPSKLLKKKGLAPFLTFKCRPPPPAPPAPPPPPPPPQQQLQLQLRYNYTTLHYTKRHYTNYNYNHNYNYATLHYATLHYTTLDYTTLHYPTFSLHPYNVTATTLYTLVTPHHNYNSTMLHLRLQLQYTKLYTSSSCGWDDHCNHCNHSNKHTPTTFRSISGFALPSVIHNNQPLL